MSAEPWKKWRPEELRELAKNYGPSLKSDALESFAALLEAEQRGERCVLPEGVQSLQICTVQDRKGWMCVNGFDTWPMGKGETQESAILDLARKLRKQ